MKVFLLRQKRDLSFYFLLQMAKACVVHVEIAFFGARFQLRTFLLPHKGDFKMIRPDSTGTRLRAIRLQKAMTQKEFADLFGITRDLYARYETNLCLPSVKVLCKMASVLKVSTDYLLCLTDAK